MNADQILNAIEAEYKYWRDHTDDKNEGVAWQAMGAVGACANLLAVGSGVMQERDAEAPGSDDGLKLLPCPFCGGKAVSCFYSEWGQSYAIRCDDCKFQLHSESGVHRVPREIELMWNRRRLTTIVPETPKAGG